MKKETTWIIAIVAILVIGMFVQKQYGLFAALPPGEYIQFRTTDLSYVSGSEIAFVESCGQSLIPYSRVSSYPNYYNDCLTTIGQRVGSSYCDISTAHQVLMLIPGGWMIDSTGVELWKCESNPEYLFVCDTKGGTNSEVRRYYETATYTIDTRNTESIDPSMEVICGTGEPQPVCGDGVQEYWEDCDGTDLAGYTCSNFGFTGGILSCTSSCTFDVSGCTGGDGIPECLLVDSNANGKVDNNEFFEVATRWIEVR